MNLSTVNILKNKKLLQCDVLCSGVAMDQWLACWPYNPRVAGSIHCFSYFLDETINQDLLFL